MIDTPNWFTQAVTETTYQQSCQYRARYRQLLQPIFAQYDVLFSPVTQGPAPLGLANQDLLLFVGYGACAVYLHSTFWRTFDV